MSIEIFRLESDDKASEKDIDKAIDEYKDSIYSILEDENGDRV